MKTYQLSKKLLNRLASALDASVYRCCWYSSWNPSEHDYDNKVDYLSVYKMDYTVYNKTNWCKLVLKNGKELKFVLGQALKLDDQFVSPDEFVRAMMLK